jgi:hypothetical protein
LAIKGWSKNIYIFGHLEVARKFQESFKSNEEQTFFTQTAKKNVFQTV